MRGRIVLVALSLAALVSPAWGFGFTAGAPVEERFGSDAGPESYYRNAERCRTVVIKDRKGHRIRVKRCR